MPLLAPILPSEFAISLFGAQYHGSSLSESRAALIQQFETLLDESAVFVEKLIHDDSERGMGLSRIWVSYWKSPHDYQRWWDEPDTAMFWAALPDDAGFWRETMRFYSTRFVTEQSQETPAGVGHLGQLVPLTEKTGYWGALRDRIQESTTQNKLLSSLPAVPEPRQPNSSIRRGRVKMTEFPENVCYVLEGQDHTLMKEDEGKLWSSKFHHNTKRFVTNVVRSGVEGGMLSARLCHVPESGIIPVEPSDVVDEPDIFPALEHNRTVELFFFLDFHYMERAGRRDKAHVCLRRDFMDAYGPTGIMSEGKMFVWVDCGVLKPKDIEAEYIGCYDTTGFLAYDHHPEFQSAPTTFNNAWSSVRSILSLAY